jgi:broad specificity phosphatase PhoE
VRHGQSEANLDKAVNARLPDHRVALSTEGHAQAGEVGDYLARLLNPHSPDDAIICSVDAAIQLT